MSGIKGKKKIKQSNPSENNVTVATVPTLPYRNNFTGSPQNLSYINSVPSCNFEIPGIYNPFKDIYTQQNFGFNPYFTYWNSSMGIPYPMYYFPIPNMGGQ